jgi:hypothetical protein
LQLLSALLGTRHRTAGCDHVHATESFDEKPHRGTGSHANDTVPGFDIGQRAFSGIAFVGVLIHVFAPTDDFPDCKNVLPLRRTETGRIDSRLPRRNSAKVA